MGRAGLRTRYRTRQYVATSLPSSLLRPGLECRLLCSKALTPGLLAESRNQRKHGFTPLKLPAAHSASHPFKEENDMQIVKVAPCPGCQYSIRFSVTQRPKGL